MDRRDITDSFDPRSWGRKDKPAAGSSAPDGPQDKTTSFDPSTWADRKPAEPATNSKPTSAPRPVPKRIVLASASALAILIAGGVAAYVSAPDTPQVTAAAAPAPALADQPIPVGHSRRTFTITGPEMFASALVDLGIAPDAAQSIAGQALAAMGSSAGEIRLDAQLAPGEGDAVSLVALEATRSDGSGVALTSAPDGSFVARKLDTRLATRIMSARGEMDGESFYTSAVAAGINDAVISDFAAAFSFDVDFQREVKTGDIFEAAYEQAYNPAGEAVGIPRLLFASLRLTNKSLRLYRFKAPGEAEHGWFDANGGSNVRSLMRTPLDGARVSSNFGYRIHPVHGGKRLHRGTDFAAPVGTRVYASAEGEVVTAGPNRCAGNMIRIQHKEGRRTHYFHLSAFSEGVQPGVHVRQGQVIGLVGNTGTCTTGPHLHYEVWINEEPVDSLTLDTGTGVTLEGAALAAFKQERDRIDLARSQRLE